MKTIFITLTTLLFSVSSFAGQAVNFTCSNAPASKWATYYCAFGDLSADGKTITNMIFGTCEGSSADGEQEPVDTFDFQAIHHNPALAARSNQWKTVGAFDVSTDLGPAVFYYYAGAPVARLKINDKDLRLECH